MKQTDEDGTEDGGEYSGENGGDYKGENCGVNGGERRGMEDIRPELFVRKKRRRLEVQSLWKGVLNRHW